MKKTLMGMLVVAIALTPSFASAGSFAYDVPALGMEKYSVLGTNPRLNELAGDAEIDHVDVIAPGVLDVWVECLSASVDCKGFIVTD